MTIINFSNISFVIPSNREKNYTSLCVPLESEIILPTSSPLGRARNDGIMLATKEWVALCDDDLTFNDIFLMFVCGMANENSIIGLEAYYPSPFVIGRFMFFSKKLWDDVGIFEIRAHGDETEWCYRAVKKDYDILRIARESVYHHPHQKIKPKSEIPNLLWLMKKHPGFLWYISKLVFLKMKRSSYDREYKSD